VRIWNIFSFFIENLKYSINESDSFYKLIRFMWHSFLKLAIDIIPETKGQFHIFLKKYFMECKWYEVYNFLEFLYQNLPYSNEKFKESVNIVLEEELSGYRIIGNEVAQITDKKEIKEIEDAFLKTKENKLTAVYKHLDSALSKLSNKKQPDYRNSIKESISAVESISKIISANHKAKFGEALEIIEKNIGIHKALKKGFLAIYGYSSDAGGIRHAMTDELNPVYFEDAKFMLIACSALINYLIVKADKSGISFK
ncbi:unnamed protein product, partial [marine sediment metagenome]